MLKKFKFRTSQKLKTIVSTALIMPLTAFTLSTECITTEPVAETETAIVIETETAIVTETETEVVTTEPTTQETTQPESVTEAEKPTEPENSENTTKPEITNKPDKNTSSGYTNDNGLYVNETLNPNWDSSGHLTAYGGVYQGPSGKETYYNLPMSNVVNIMRNRGFDEENYPYWEREDGCKMLGDYIMVAADLNIRPKGSLVETSLGMGLVCDTGDFIHSNRTQLDIAVTW